MGDILEDFVNETALTVGNVRKLVDDYSLISHYLGQELELHTKYSSPLREGDENPSFSMFYGYGSLDKDILYFKDQIGIAQGDIYSFLKQYLGAKTIKDLLQQINFDLQLGLNGEESNLGLKPTIIKRIPIEKERPKIEIVSQKPTKIFTNYWWDRYEIQQPCLDYYNTKCIRDIHYVYSKHSTIVTPRDLCIGYPIGKHNKIYQPFESKEFKFRNDYPQNYVEGYLQIDWSRNDLLVISKSSKENIFFRQHWNIQSICGKSETTEIPDYIMYKCLSHFKRVFLWLDPDEAGIRAMINYKFKYPKLEVVQFLPEIKEKDPTDIFEVHRKKITTEIVKQILKI